MISIGLLSDTHGFLHERLLYFFDKVDEIWHAGDIGHIELADRLAAFKPFKAVYGNIDGKDIRSVYPRHLRFFCEDVDVWVTHIGGYPGKYGRAVSPAIYNDPPNLFISGHSHILKIIYDEKLKLLHMNPGASGYYGFHKKLTAVRFIIDGSNLRDVEIWEMNRF